MAERSWARPVQHVARHSLELGLVVPEAVDRFRDHIDPVWVEEALAATGTATVRRRRLPADQVLWLVVGMALLRNELTCPGSSLL